METLPDAQLASLMADGDQGAASELHRRFRPPMLAFARRIARDPSLAEDAVQDAFVQAWRDASRYESSRGTVLAWLQTITRARTLDRLRTEQLRASRRRVDVDPDTTHARESLPDQQCETARRQALIGVALELLPSAERRPMDLAFHGFTHTEIASRLALPIGTAKTQLRRGMTTLRAAVDRRADRPFEWELPAPAPPARLDGVTALVVDDDEDTVRLTMLVLRRAGATVVTAASAERVTQRLSSLNADVLLIDLNMPGRSGYELLSEIRSQAPLAHTPSIAFTSCAAPSERRRTRAAGFDAHLAKPVRPSALLEQVASLVHTGSGHLSHA